MLQQFTDIAPKALVAAGIVWAGANYLVIGPEIASRVARADHVPVCEAGFKEAVVKAGEARMKALPVPSVNRSQEMATAQLRRLRDNPFMLQLRQLGGGAGDMFGIGATTDMAIEQYEEGKRAAKAAYASALERIKAQTATELGKAGDVCGCVADATIAETRTEWALFSGTLGLIRPAPLKGFDEKMAQIERAGGCHAQKENS